MLLIFCSRHDTVAHAFAERFRDRGARAVTCADVAQPGWKLRVTTTAGDVQVDAAAVISGERMAADRILGVITRLHAVTETEVVHVARADRSYAAAEMHAFLFAFLDALDCEVANRPSPACLCGPNLRATQWRQLARRLGIPLNDSTTIHREGSFQRFVEVAVVGGSPVGDVHEPLSRWSRELACIAGVQHLVVRYVDQQGGMAFAGADPRPRLESADVGKALVELLRGREAASC